MNYVKENQDAITGGIIAVSIGIMGKYLFKTQLLPAKNFGEIFTTFTVVTISGIAANELKNKYPITM